MKPSVEYSAVALHVFGESFVSAVTSMACRMNVSLSIEIGQLLYIAAGFVKSCCNKLSVFHR